VRIKDLDALITSDWEITMQQVCTHIQRGRAQDMWEDCAHLLIFFGGDGVNGLSPSSQSHQVIPFIDGIRYVKKIARDSGIHIELVLECMKNLLYYECITMIDVFQVRLLVS